MASKSTLITGCSKDGIGDGLAREFKSRGLRVFAAGRDPAKLAHLHDLGITVLILDVTDSDSIATAAATVRQATELLGSMEPIDPRSMISVWVRQRVGMLSTMSPHAGSGELDIFPSIRTSLVSPFYTA